MRNYILLTCIIFITNIYAQKIIVKDAQTLEPISNVYLYSQCKSGLTNREGVMDLSDFCVDSIVSLQHASYIGFEINLNKLDKDKLNEILLIPDIFNIEEVVVSASKWNEDHRETSATIEKITAKEAQIYSPQTSADLLTIESKVFVQKSQLGGGSPMIRGFSANRILLVVDGVRLNNAIYRGGNLQNVLNIDVNAVENVEIIFGPGSVIYGSDALGGVINYTLLKPSFSDEFDAKTNAFIRFSSANMEKTASASVKLSSKKWSSVTSLSNGYFSDLTMGSNGHSSYDRDFYVLNNGKKDSVFTNHNKDLQIGSAYAQLSLLQKVAFKPDENWEFAYNFYYSELSDVPRYDRLIQTKNNEPKYAEWYYGPQKWMMNSLSVSNKKRTAIYDELKIVAAHQNYQESRHKRKLYKSVLNQQYEMVNMFTVDFDFYKKLNVNNTLYYGIEAFHNLVNSRANDYDIYSNNEQDAATRYPNGATYSSAAFYISDKHYLTEKLIVNAGIRANYIATKTEFDKSFYNFPYDNANNSNTALSGNLGLVYLPNISTKVSFNLSSGFRAPNIDDLAKVFDSGHQTIVVPNPTLEPEYVYNVDFTLEKQLWKKVQFLINGFYSHLDNAMIVSDFQFGGQDSIMFDGQMSKVEAVTNKDFANIYGAQASLNWNFYRNVSLKSSANYTRGKDSQGYAIRHVSPFFGATHLVFDNTRLIIDAYAIYNAQVKYKYLAQTEREKTHIYDTDSNGNPYASAWQTFNLKLSYKINYLFSVSGGVENIFDTRYRPYSSGIAAPGRNFLISLRISSF